MNTFSKATLFATAVALSFSACKKGEDDPFLSLRSRDARITNTWNLTSIDGTETYMPDSFTDSTVKKETKVSYTGSAKNITTTTTTTDNVGKSTIKMSLSTSSYSKTLEIKKGGEYTTTIKSTPSLSSMGGIPVIPTTTTTTTTGQWNWADDNKAKSVLVLDGENYSIRKLSKKELVLTQKSEDNSSNSTSMGGMNLDTGGKTINSKEYTYTYEAK